MADLSKIYLFRMTHIQNVPHILEHGITHRQSENANPDYEPIGDGGLIGTRNAKRIWVNNGEGFSFDHAQITLGDFTPFYFGKRMPMLFVIQKGYNGVKKQMPADIVYCVCTLKRIVDEGNVFYFTDGHATDNLSACYDSSNVKAIDQYVNFDVVKLRDWTSGRDLKRRMEAECLVAGDIPADCIVGFICYNEAAKNQLAGMNIAEALLHVKPNYYF